LSFLYNQTKETKNYAETKRHMITLPCLIWHHYRLERDNKKKNFVTF